MWSALTSTLIAKYSRKEMNNLLHARSVCTVAEYFDRKRVLHTAFTSQNLLFPFLPLFGMCLFFSDYYTMAPMPIGIAETLIVILRPNFTNFQRCLTSILVVNLHLGVGIFSFFKVFFLFCPIAK